MKKLLITLFLFASSIVLSQTMDDMEYYYYNRNNNTWEMTINSSTNPSITMGGTGTISVNWGDGSANGWARGVPLWTAGFRPAAATACLGEAIAEPHDDHRDNQGSDGAVQVIAYPAKVRPTVAMTAG